MGVYKRTDSPVYWLLLDGYKDARGRPWRERTKIRHDAPTAQGRNDNLKLAKLRYHARMTEMAQGITSSDDVTSTVPLFATQAEWFRVHRLPHRKGREREAALLPKLVAALGHLRLDAVTRTAVTELWITPRLTTPTVIAKKRLTAARSVKAGPRTINREVAVIKAILQSAVPDHLEVSPLYGMELLTTTTPQRRLLTEAEEARLLEAFVVDDRALFLLGLDSLVRLMDLLDAKRTDDRGRTLWIRDPKAGGGFEVPISARARQALDAWYKAQGTKATEEYIFWRRRRAKTERDRRAVIRRMLQLACARADVPYGRAKGGVTFHWATRRTGLTRMLTRGVDLGTAQKVGRWKTADVVLAVYHELVDDVAHAAVNAVGTPPQSRNSENDQKS